MIPIYSDLDVKGSLTLTKSITTSEHINASGNIYAGGAVLVPHLKASSMITLSPVEGHYGEGLALKRQAALSNSKSVLQYIDFFYYPYDNQTLANNGLSSTPKRLSLQQEQNGQTIDTLKYTAAPYFNFDTSLRVQGNMTVTKKLTVHAEDGGDSLVLTNIGKFTTNGWKGASRSLFVRELGRSGQAPSANGISATLQPIVLADYYTVAAGNTTLFNIATDKSYLLFFVVGYNNPGTGASTTYPNVTEPMYVILPKGRSDKEAIDVKYTNAGTSENITLRFQPVNGVWNWKYSSTSFDTNQLSNFLGNMNFTYCMQIPDPIKEN